MKHRMEEQTNATTQRHVLVVDDNADLAQTYQDLFQTHDYKVSVAATGLLALKLLGGADVDAIVCDMSMPQLDGAMFFTSVERVRPNLARRFVFVTGNFNDPRYGPFLKKTGVPVLYKPVSADKLLETLDSLFTPGAANETPGWRRQQS